MRREGMRKKKKRRKVGNETMKDVCFSIVHKCWHKDERTLLLFHMWTFPSPPPPLPPYQLYCNVYRKIRSYNIHYQHQRHSHSRAEDKVISKALSEISLSDKTAWNPYSHLQSIFHLAVCLWFL